MLTKTDIERANQMHSAGVSWQIIAALLKTDIIKLRRVESITTTNKRMTKLAKQYAYLLQMAEITENRKDALFYIHQADSIRQEMATAEAISPMEIRRSMDQASVRA